MEDVTALLVALAAAFGPLAIGVTKLVDATRGIVDPNTKLKGSWLWIAASVVWSLAACLLFGIDVVEPIVAQVPKFADANMNDTVAQVLTGLGVAGMASYWHERMSATSAQSA